jgi:Ras-related protein Rab-1A
MAHYDYLFKFFIRSDCTVGKSSFVIRLVDNSFVEYASPMNSSFRLRVVQLDSKVIRAQIWDIVGAERYRCITPLHYRGTQGIFVVYDVTNRASFIEVPHLLSEIRLLAPQDVAVLLLGNKSDLEAQRAVSFNEGKALADEFRISFMETSAKTSANVEAAFIAIAAQVKARIESSAMSYEETR